MISDNVKAIGANAFDNCSELSEIKLPASLNVICDEMFSGCTSLTSVVIPDSVTAIHKGAFSGCANITEISYKGKTCGRDNLIELYKDLNGEEWLSMIIDKTV